MNFLGNLRPSGGSSIEYLPEQLSSQFFHSFKLPSSFTSVAHQGLSSSHLVSEPAVVGGPAVVGEMMHSLIVIP